MTSMDLPLSRAARERYEFKDPILPPAPDAAAGPAIPDAASTLVRRMSERRAPRLVPPAHRAPARGDGGHPRGDAPRGGGSRRRGRNGCSSRRSTDSPATSARVRSTRPCSPSTASSHPSRSTATSCGLRSTWPAQTRTVHGESSARGAAPALARPIATRRSCATASSSTTAARAAPRSTPSSSMGCAARSARPDGSGGPDLIATLLAPIEASPDSLAAQLRYIREHGPAAADLVDRLASDEMLSELDAIEDLATPAVGVGGGGPPDAQALHGFAGLDAELEGFSPDRHWMPRVVLIAKTTYVWLDQLSRAYGRPIRTPRPDPRRGARHASRRSGFTGLWLIGLWERSRGVAAHQADARQPRGRGVGLLADGLPHRRRPRRRGGLSPTCATGPGRAASASPATWCPTTWASTHAGSSSIPTGSCSARDPPYPGLLVQRAEPVVRRARRHLHRGPLLRQHRRRGDVQARRPLERRGALHLPRQRRHIDAVERHGAARLPQARRCARRSSRPSSTSRAASRSSASTPR